MRIHITQAHIDEAAATRRSSLVVFSGAVCPVALAMRDAGCDQPVVGRETAHDSEWRYKLCEATQAFVRDFDGRKPVRPLTGQLRRLGRTFEAEQRRRGRAA